MISYTSSQMIVMPIMLVTILGISLLIGRLLRGKSDKIRHIPIVIVASLLLALEVIKQTYLIVNHKWSYWSIPVHFCSALMLWYAIAAYSKEGSTLRQVGYGTSFAGSLLMNILFYIGPSSIFGNACDNPIANFNTFHTFTFHFVAISMWMLILTLDLYRPTKRNYIYSIISFALYFCVIIACAYIFDTNYTNALHSNIPFMEQFRLFAGQFWYTVVSFVAGLSAIAGILALYWVIYNKVRNRPRLDKQINN